MPTNTAGAAILAIPIILGGEVRGSFFEGDCNRPGAYVRIPALPELTDGRVRPIVLSTGNILGPEPLSSLALEAPNNVSDDLLSLLKRDNGRPVFDGVLPGEFELSADPATLARLNFDGRTPWTVANIPLRAQHRRYRVFLRQGVRIGLTAVIDDALLPLVDPAHNHGAIESAAQLLSRSVQVLRQAGVQVVVAMLHTQRANGLERVLKLLESARVDLPDVILTSALDMDPTAIHLDGLRTVVVPAPRSAAEAAVVRLHMDEARRITRIEAERLPVPATPSGLADILRNWACKRLDIPLSAIDWSGPIPRGLFKQFVLERMRQEASAEVAIISKQTLGSASAFPLPKSPTRLHLRAALPFAGGLQVTRIRGSVLAKLERLLSDVRVHVLGLEAGGRVAGRTRDPRRIYKVVTVDFLADGGDAVIDPTRYKFRPVKAVPSLRDMIAKTLDTQGFHPDANDDPDEKINEPALFDVRVDLGASLKSVNVENGSGAEAPQLIRENFLGVTGNLEARLTLDLTRHRFELSNLTRFGVVRENFAEGDGTKRSRTRENEDVTRIEAVYKGRLAGGQDRPWLPDASATASLETELTRPKDERSYHRALLQLGLGPAWQLAGNLSLRAQLGLRRELFAPRTSDPAEVSLAETKIASLFGAQLRDEVFESYAAHPITLNVRLDYIADLSGRVRDQVFQSRVSLDVPITNAIALTAALDVYLLSRNRSRDYSLSGGALDTSFGIKSSADFSQLFR